MTEKVTIKYRKTAKVKPVVGTIEKCALEVYEARKTIAASTVTVKTRQDELVHLLVEVEDETHTFEHDGVKYTVKRIAPEAPTFLDDEKLKKTLTSTPEGEKVWNDITNRVLDMKKFQAAVDLGLIDKETVEAVKVTGSAPTPHVKVTTKLK